MSACTVDTEGRDSVRKGRRRGISHEREAEGREVCREVEDEAEETGDSTAMMIPIERKERRTDFGVEGKDEAVDQVRG